MGSWWKLWPNLHLFLWHFPNTRPFVMSLFHGEPFAASLDSRMPKNFLTTFWGSSNLSFGVGAFAHLGQYVISLRKAFRKKVHVGCHCHCKHQSKLTPPCKIWLRHGLTLQVYKMHCNFEAKPLPSIWTDSVMRHLVKRLTHLSIYLQIYSWRFHIISWPGLIQMMWLQCSGTTMRSRDWHGTKDPHHTRVTTEQSWKHTMAGNTMMTMFPQQRNKIFDSISCKDTIWNGWLWNNTPESFWSCIFSMLSDLLLEKERISRR